MRNLTNFLWGVTVIMASFSFAYGQGGRLSDFEAGIEAMTQGYTPMKMRRTLSFPRPKDAKLVAISMKKIKLIKGDEGGSRQDLGFMVRSTKRQKLLLAPNCFMGTELRMLPLEYETMDPGGKRLFMGYNGVIFLDFVNDESIMDWAVDFIDIDHDPDIEGLEEIGAIARKLSGIPFDEIISAGAKVVEGQLGNDDFLTSHGEELFLNDIVKLLKSSAKEKFAEEDLEIVYSKVRVNDSKTMYSRDVKYTVRRMNKKKITFEVEVVINYALFEGNFHYEDLHKNFFN